MKKSLFILSLFLISATLFAQINMVSKKIFLDSLYREATPENYSYTRVITNYSQKSVRYVVTDFYKNGRKKMTGTTLDRDVLKKDGEFIYYYKNSTKESVVNFKEDHKEGKEINWYENQSKKSEKQNIWNPKTKTVQTLILNFWNANKEQTVVDGNGKYEDTDNFITEKGTIKNGLKQGIWQGSDAERKITFTENYDKGILISGVSVDENNIKLSYSSLAEKQFSKKTASKSIK
jgi:antitoxin component YwqK of YwqJK toxin-antitoxin module